MIDTFEITIGKRKYQVSKGITREEIASILSLSESTIKREIATLKEMAILTRVGGRYSGHWVVRLQR